MTFHHHAWVPTGRGDFRCGEPDCRAWFPPAPPHGSWRPHGCVCPPGKTPRRPRKPAPGTDPKTAPRTNGGDDSEGGRR